MSFRSPQGHLTLLKFMSFRIGAKIEAAYERQATEWLMQHGDLDLNLKNIPEGPSGSGTGGNGGGKVHLVLGMGGMGEVNLIDSNVLT
jgi:hypothetical protein